MSNDFSDAEVYLAIKSAFAALKELSKKSLHKRALPGHYPAFKKSMDKVDAIIKKPRFALGMYRGGKKSIADKIIDDIEGILGATADHDLYVMFHNISVYIDHWMTCDQNEKQAKKIIAESKRLNNLLELENSNALVRPFKKLAQKFFQR
jgi:hypothetical protein